MTFVCLFKTHKRIRIIHLSHCFSRFFRKFTFQKAFRCPRLRIPRLLKEIQENSVPAPPLPADGGGFQNPSAPPAPSSYSARGAPPESRFLSFPWPGFPEIQDII